MEMNAQYGGPLDGDKAAGAVSGATRCGTSRAGTEVRVTKAGVAQTAGDDARSITSSRISRSSVASNVKLAEAKVKQELAKLRKEQFLKEQRLRREQYELNEKLETLQVENEIESANVETAIWQQEINGQTCNLNNQEPLKPVITSNAQVDVSHRTNDWCEMNRMYALDNKPVVDTPVSNGNDKTCVTSAQMYMAMNLPKPEIKRFAGDPIEYWGFTNNFEVNVAQRVHDDRQKLSYLIQFCSGKAHNAIDNCVLLDHSVGYKRAQQILYDQFGRNYIVAGAHTSRVVNRPNIRCGDGQSMWDLARDMRRCQMTLTQMGYTADMSTTDNLLKIQRLLPVYLQSKWANAAHKLMETKVVPNFSHMTDFVEEQAKVGSNVYGQNVGKSMKPSKTGSPFSKGNDHKASTFAVQERKDNPTKNDSCPCCAGKHAIYKCDKFKAKPPQERFVLAQQRGLCFNCLQGTHLARRCNSKVVCSKEGCKRKHHTLLHAEPKSKEGSSLQNGVGKGLATSAQEVECNTVGSRRDVCLRVLPVKIKHEEKEMTTWALLDEGSDISLCEEGIAEELGLKGDRKNFRLTTVNSSEVERQGMEVSLMVRGAQGGERIEMPQVWTVKKLSVSRCSIPRQEDVNKWSHLRGIELPSTEDADVRLLIGSDTPEAFWVQEERRGLKKEPYAIRSPLGWTLIGSTSSPKGRHVFGVNHVLAEEELHDQVKRFWQLDYGLGDKEEKLGESVEDRRARTAMETSVTLENGHYQIGLPWRQYPPSLPNNRNLADRRLQSLKRRLEKDRTLHSGYKTTIENYIKKGHAKEVGESERDAKKGIVWYLPHHPVTHPMKPEKVRVVFDCAAKFQGVSLNSQLLQGPDFTNKLVGVLMRFRQDKVALVADVEGMFHQVRVSTRDIDVLRFLWWQDGELSKTPKEYQMLVHLFGATSSPSCAGFALRRTVQDNERDFDADVAKTVLENFYVDDCLTSVSTTEEGMRLLPQLCELLRRGGFRLTKWVSNDREVLSTVPATERAASVINLDLDHLPIERTLGVLWNVDTDEFNYKVSIKETPMTRRGILSATSSLYDPLGFVAPFILKAKLLLQDLCAQDKGWDERVGDEEVRCWQNWVDELPDLTSSKIARCFKPPNFKEANYELHAFCDASERAYAACAYLRIFDSDGKVHCTFVMGKTRLCPLKRMTVPRLELSAAVLAVKLVQVIKEELRLPLQGVTYWTDSTSVLQYISNESRRFRTFVANRVAKIQEMSDTSQWRHVDSGRNPADDGSRGVHAKDLSRWLTGPEFLTKARYKWPDKPVGMSGKAALPDTDLKGDPEVKQTQVYATESPDLIEELITRYSSWIHLKRAIAWILRYKSYLCSRARGEAAFKDTGPQTAQELEAAEREVIKFVQRQSFPEEFQRDAAEMKVKARKRTSPIERLNPILRDGLLRVGGRLDRASLPDEQKHPLILPNDHHVTKLLIVHHHREVGHSGAGMTWTSLRQKCWIIKGGAAVRHTIGNCILCKKRNTTRGQQFMADLPEARVTPDKPPFSSTGVDYFGPFLVKQGRSQVKRYGCIFTCMSSRAVHLEVAFSLDTDSFIHALRRFINRRGPPEHIFSDNGTNFKGGHKELQDSLAALNTKKVNDFLVHRGVEWHFNPPGASHMGGVWERIIRSVRRILGNLLQQQTVTDESLVTIMTEVEAILNARPLTQLSMDSKDDEPLTPNHLLLLRRNPSLPPGVFIKEDCYNRRRWRQAQYLADQFWRRWVQEYLPLLQQRQKWTKPKRNFEVDDLVLVADDNAPRGHWPLGRVVTTYPDRHGLTRQVEVKVGSRFYKRPISKLCLLEEGGATCNPLK